MKTPGPAVVREWLAGNAGNGQEQEPSSPTCPIACPGTQH
ncbi:hypothetical protein DVDV_1421 [Desulfovibrio sp. DV]|nr:hypothetical protein DVDV_1421 [Desulfovibrio sp. DV]